MKKLTGLTLYDMVDRLRSEGKTIKEIVIACGYDREGRVPNYTEFYQNLIMVRSYSETMRIRQTHPSRKILQKITDSMAHFTSYNKGNDRVEVGEFYHHGELLVRITPMNFVNRPTIILFEPRIKSRSSKERINAIIRRIIGYSLYQKKGRWYISRPLLNDMPYNDGMVIYFPSPDDPFPG